MTVIGLINFRAGCEESVRKRSVLGWNGRSIRMTKKSNENSEQFGLSVLPVLTSPDSLDNTYKAHLSKSASRASLILT